MKKDMNILYYDYML